MQSRDLGTALAVFALSAALSTNSYGQATDRKPDLGDSVQGVYAGDVVSDSQGSSHANVTLTLTRVGRNLVSIQSDYPRLPAVTVALTRATGKIVNRGGSTAFFLDPSKSPPKLDVSFNNQVSWSGARR